MHVIINSLKCAESTSFRDFRNSVLKNQRICSYVVFFNW